MWSKQPSQTEVPAYTPSQGQGASPSSYNSNAGYNAAPAPRPASPTARNVACLGASLEVKGKISGAEDLQVDGKVEGPIALQGQRLTVGASGQLASEVAAREEGDVFVNVQGDEPLLDPKAIDVAVNSLLEEPQASISTVATPIKTPGDIMDPNVVKAVLDFDGNAIYFSRAPIPWVRDTASKIQVRHLKHLGLYVFQREALLEYPTLPQGELERIEQLEQLRWLENGWKIRVAEVEHDAVSVDVPEDVARVEKLLQR